MPSPNMSGWKPDTNSADLLRAGLGKWLWIDACFIQRIAAKPFASLAAHYRGQPHTDHPSA
ncbi:hypothetical protein RvVAR031_42980 [Agrobacterium vitis]|nr:hypothetical protein RvVAR031_42980 [Agrobacterium vitis]